MDKPSIDVVLKALGQLYNGTDPKETEEASKWLMQLQRSVCLNSAHPLYSAHPVPVIYHYFSLFGRSVIACCNFHIFLSLNPYSVLLL